MPGAGSRDIHGVVRFDRTDGGTPIFYAINPESFQDLPPALKTSRLRIERLPLTYETGEVLVRNAGNGPAKILAIQSTAGDLVWRVAESDQCTGKTLEPFTGTCTLHFAGDRGKFRFHVEREEVQELDVVIEDDDVVSPTPPDVTTPDIKKTAFAQEVPGNSDPRLDLTPRYTFKNLGGSNAHITTLESFGRLYLSDYDSNRYSDSCTNSTLVAGSSSCSVEIRGSHGTLRFHFADGTSDDVAIDSDRELNYNVIETGTFKPGPPPTWQWDRNDDPTVQPLQPQFSVATGARPISPSSVRRAPQPALREVVHPGA